MRPILRIVLQKERFFSTDWRTIVGLELHVQLNSSKKLFSPAPRTHDAVANSQYESFDAAIPGSMPVLNGECIDLAIKGALALGCHINEESTFDRKHYEYPDLPSGYQITQYRRPFAHSGMVELGGGKRIRIKQVHLEHDSAKTLVDEHGKLVLIDLNRCGIPLIEIVTLPDIEGAEEAVETAKSIVETLRDAGVTPGVLAHGNVRIDVNVSLTGPRAPLDAPPLGDRVEIKNLNSFVALRQAIKFEVKRQSSILESKARVPRETRSFIEKSGETVGTREKDGSSHYRYLPEPDLPSLMIPGGLVENLRRALPETRAQRLVRLQERFGFTLEQANKMVQTPQLLKLFEGLNSKIASPILVFNFLTNEFVGIMHKLSLNVDDIDVSNVEPMLFEILVDLKANKITSFQARLVLSKRLQGDQSPIFALIGSNMTDCTKLPDKFMKMIDEMLQKLPKKLKLIQSQQAEGTSIDFLLGPLLRVEGNQLTPQDLKVLVKGYIVDNYLLK